MEQEFHRFILLKNYSDFQCSKLNLSKAYEFQNILERWLVSWAQDQHYLDPILSKKIYNSNHPINRLFLLEIKKKNINLPNALKDLISVVRNFYKKPAASITEWKIQDNTIKIKTKKNIQTFEFNPERKKYLMKKHSLEIDFIILVIRYACLLPRGQQWTVPMHIFYKIHEKINITLEAFASPFNSLGLMFNVPYCSLFDIDKKYGSVGNFFKYRIKESDKIFINPPFVLDILNSMAILDVPNAIIFTPEWKDAKFYKFLRNKPYHDVLKPGQYYYETSDGKIIKSKFASHIWSDFDIIDFIKTEFKYKK